MQWGYATFFCLATQPLAPVVDICCFKHKSFAVTKWDCVDRDIKQTKLWDCVHQVIKSRFVQTNSKLNTWRQSLWILDVSPFKFLCS